MKSLNQSIINAKVLKPTELNVICNVLIDNKDGNLKELDALSKSLIYPSYLKSIVFDNISTKIHC